MKFVFATSLRARLVGLLGTRNRVEDLVLVLAPCKSIHTIGMRYAIDIAFIDQEATVLSSELAVPSGRIRSDPRAAAVLERHSMPGCYWPRPGERLCLYATGRGGDAS